MRTGRGRVSAPSAPGQTVGAALRREARTPAGAERAEGACTVACHALPHGDLRDCTAPLTGDEDTRPQG